MAFGRAPKLEDHRLRGRIAPARAARRVFANAAGVATALLIVALALPIRSSAQEQPGIEGRTSTPASNTTASSSATAHPDADPARPARHDAEPGARATDPPSATEAAPPDLRDLDAWLAFKAHRHISALPLEARVFYRRGLMASLSGQREESMRLVRGAVELDPTFLAPHLTLASWLLAAAPSQALLQYAAVLDLERQHFSPQLELMANALLLGIEALFLGLLFAGVLLVWLRNRELCHAWHELLSDYISPRTARIWSWMILVLPYFLGLGLALPTVVFLGLLWPSLKARERLVFATLTLMLGCAPLVTSSLGRLSVALQEDQGPFYGAVLLENQPYSVDRQRHFEALAAAHPENPFIQFGLAWTARRGGDLATAEAGFRRALEHWPKDDRVLTDLGNTLAMKGRQDEALEFYKRAITANPDNAAAHFNASQIYTQRFDYRAASEEVNRASALDFELVRGYQSSAGSSGVLPLADQWISPSTFWAALAARPRVPSALPMAWRARPECSGWRYSVAVLLFAAFGLAAGLWQHRATPLRACSNCGTVLCRRCAARRRELALCPRCAQVEAQAESPEFARVLLLQQRRKATRAADLTRTALAAILPGYGLLAFRHTFLPILLLAVSASLARGWLGLSAPYAVEPRLALPGQSVPVAVLVTAWLAVYAISLSGYLTQLARARAQAERLAAPTRSRATQARHAAPPIAA